VPVKYRNRYGKVRTYDTTYNGIVDWLSASATRPTVTGRASRPSSTCARSSAPPAAANVCKPEVLAVRCTATTSPR
jgi:hypothetical protein